MFQIELDLILRFTPPMAEHYAGFRLTRSFELPFAPTNGSSVFSQQWEGLDEPLGYILNNVTWDLDRGCFVAETENSITGIPIALIPHEIKMYVDFGWAIGSYKDQYATLGKSGRKRRKLPVLEISGWEDEEAESWQLNKTDRPKEFKKIWHAVVAMMVDLCNDSAVAYAMLKLGIFVAVPTSEFAKLSPIEIRFRDATHEYETLTFEKMVKWRERIVGRYPRMKDVVEAIE